jgi:flagellar basal body-associated protein FliL
MGPEQMAVGIMPIWILIGGLLVLLSLVLVAVVAFAAASGKRGSPGASGAACMRCGKWTVPYASYCHHCGAELKPPLHK